MLTLDRTEWSSANPERVVARRCALFGHPTIIRLLPPDCRREYGIAVVKMPSSVEAMKIASEFGDARSGAIVLIRLAQRENQ